jgi:hypothetical protein
MAKILVVKDDHSIKITSTLESLSGTCAIDAAVQLPDGTFDLLYCGYTEISWDEQKTVKRDGQRVFLGDNDQEYLESEIELIDEPEDDEE